MLLRSWEREGRGCRLLRPLHHTLRLCSMRATLWMHNSHHLTDAPVTGRRYECAGAGDAEALAARVRRSACWGGRGRPPRALVIVNPASGRGR